MILQGARQVGKSWILKEFGRNEYRNLAYVNCEDEPLAENLFFDYDIARIIRSIEAITHEEVRPGETLIVLDEIQESPRGLSCLKYFQEKAPEFHVAVAGSLLGITLHSGTSFPVGKVDFLKMHPMDFEEFLWALGEERIAKALAEADKEVAATLHLKCVELLRQYYFTGGMPECVSSYCRHGSVIKVRRIQDSLLESYRNDISKHAPVREMERINLVFQALPAQLVKENKKFIFSAVRKGARASEFETAIQWLVDAGIAIKTCRISVPKVPLRFYEDFNAFKLFLLDCGLFGAFAGTEASEILIGDNVFEEYKGAFSELYVLQQLLPNLSDKVYYYSGDNSQIEIDFLYESDRTVRPIEVKAEDNLKGKSAKLFTEKYDLPFSIRISMRPYRKEERLVNIPLYAAFALKAWL